MATIVLTRHGETAWNTERRVQGWAPVPLSSQGRDQVQSLARYLQSTYDIEHIYASDLRRTTETAYLIQRTAFPHVDVTYETAWRERDFGVLQGLSYEELFEGHPEFSLTAVGIEAARAVPERGESLLAMRKRVLDRWRDLLGDTGQSDTILIVTHGGPLYIILGDVRGWDVHRSIIGRNQDNCAINEVVVEPDGPVVHVENETGFLDGKFR